MIYSEFRNQRVIYYVFYTLINISWNWDEFLKYFKRKYGQQEFDFGDMEEVNQKINNDIQKTIFDPPLKELLRVPPPKAKK